MSKFYCMHCMDGGLLPPGWMCNICGHKSSMKRQAKRSPARVSHQRRVGSTAKRANNPSCSSVALARRKAKSAPSVKCRYCGRMRKTYLPKGRNERWYFFRKHVRAGGRTASCAGSNTCTWIEAQTAHSRRRERAGRANDKLTHGPNNQEL